MLGGISGLIKSMFEEKKLQAVTEEALQESIPSRARDYTLD